MKDEKENILVYGYGNPGRQDDALGIMLAGEIEKWKVEQSLDSLEVDMNYQLNIEDAEKISNFHTVIFVDASVNEMDHFKMQKVIPDMKTDFSMHAVTPSFVTGLCQRIYGKLPDVYQLEIRGYSWEFMQTVTKKALNNLQQATDYVMDYLEKKKNLNKSK